MPYRAVIMDLDGTLLDTLADIATAANVVLEQRGFPTHALEAYAQYVGSGVKVLFEKALPEDEQTPENVDACAAEFFTAYDAQWNVLSRPYAGIADLLTTLKAREIVLAVLSNKPQLFTEKCVQYYLAKWPFLAVFGQREGIPRKPDPASALEIARLAGIPPADFLYLGDTGIDMVTAARAGMTPIGVSWGFRDVEELDKSGAAAIIHHPLELVAILDYGLPSR